MKVLNPVEIIKWNSDKHYLKDIADKGLPVIPAEHLEQGSAFNDRFFDHFDTDIIVVKPCISAGAQNTLTINRNNYHERSGDIEQLLKEQDYMVQPFVDEIKNGEWSFHLMELELIEPYLFLNGEDELQENYYQALMTLMS